MNFKSFVQITIYEPIIIMLMPLAWWRHQSKKIFVCVNAECFCLFGKLLLTWISGFFMEATIYEPIIMLMPLAWWRHQTKKIFVCVNAECFCLFDKLLLTWISSFLWKQPSKVLFLCKLIKREESCVSTSQSINAL